MAPSKNKRAAVAREKKKVTQNRSIWVEPHLQERHRVGIEQTLLTDLLAQDGNDFKNFIRMDYDTFMMLHDKVRLDIEKQDTYLRSSISSELRLAMTLRFLATGDSYRSLEYLTRVSGFYN
ncbi:unnamed protein product [Acanthoscelides obtectus]|uniref:Uncharacterized protein n=1 Tax=Acanthoscelides obtectus TaxID=200917 RepID=A0A9P0JRG9_ACAOB|nr:unnamed protein product [Acanthoscelides obtectus]CAK1667042.1 hypothetical protein AOBTE_LOCUS25636 [Acanthoscelides obtectus]